MKQLASIILIVWVTTFVLALIPALWWALRS